MPERYQWQSALATIGIEGRARASAQISGALLCERRAGSQLAIRGNASNDVFVAAV